ncbi:MAG: hypothetical protein ABW200_14800, partial [Hyphomicrobiaceae bacterium]
MAHDGKTQREAAKRTLGLATLGRPPAPPKQANGAAKAPEPPPLPPADFNAKPAEPEPEYAEDEGQRRAAKRRPAG